MSSKEEDGSDARRVSAADGIVTALPMDVSAENVDSDVISALGRWRGVDPNSLHDLAPTLWTNSGDFVDDSVGYLHALHGFVAEKIVYSSLEGSHHIIWPDQTNVAAYDMVVDGTPVQIKEGMSAYRSAQHASERYPDVTSFASDPLTAEHLREHGISAMGIQGLEPDAIAHSTRESLRGLSALEQAGQPQIPILTTIFALCKYWDRYDAEQIAASDALKFAAQDIGAQSIGAAAGLKAAAVYVVATGGFGVAALPLTLGAIVGAMGLRHLVNKARAKGLRESLDQLDIAREASETAAEIVTEHSRRFAFETVETAKAAIRKATQSFAAQWAELRDAKLVRICSVQNVRFQTLLTLFSEDSSGPLRRCAIEMTEAFSETDLTRRYLSARSCLTRLLANYHPESLVYTTAKHWLDETWAELADLNRERGVFESRAATARLALAQKMKVDLFSEYAFLLLKLSKAAEPTIEALTRVKFESEKLGVKFRTV